MNHVAIIDDDEEIIKLFDRVAKASGFESFATTDPHAFLEHAEQVKPSHILLDLQMPDIDGVEILRHLSAMESEAKVFFISGFDPKVLDVASKLGREQGLNIVEKVSKPVSAKLLKQLLLRHKDSDHCSEQRLRAGLANNEFFVVLQPQISAKSRTVKTFEALMRWNHPEHGLIAPDKFIARMEEFELYEELSGFAITQACQAIRAFERVGADDIRISVNISAGDLTDLNLATRLRNICIANGVEPQKLTLEITESVAMENPLAAMDNLARVRLQGFGLSLDDFGTGFSSLAMLRDMPFNEIKVDKTFTAELKDVKSSAEIIRAVVSIGRAFGMNVVAEGCEDTKTFKQLSELGCDLIQGFYVAKPMSLETAIELIERSLKREKVAPKL